MNGSNNGAAVRKNYSVPVRDTVVIIEDQLMFADFLKAHCEKLGMRVSAVSGSCESGLSAIANFSPHLVLLDISLPDGDGLELGEQILKLAPLTKIIAISAHRDPWTMLQVQRKGLHAFVDKTDQRSDAIEEAIKSVLNGAISRNSSFAAFAWTNCAVRSATWASRSRLRENIMRLHNKINSPSVAGEPSVACEPCHL